MNIEIQSNEDNFFSLVKKEKEVQREEVVPTVVENIPQPVVQQPIVPQETQRTGPRPAPIENNKGAGWFSGTSWGS